MTHEDKLTSKQILLKALFLKLDDSSQQSALALLQALEFAQKSLNNPPHSSTTI